MAASALEEFKTKLIAAMASFEKLDITTAVGPCKWDAAANDYVPVNDATVKVMKTEIHLFTGDTLNQIDVDFVTGNLATLRDFHAAATKDGRAIVESQIATFKSLLDLVKHFIEHS